MDTTKVLALSLALVALGAAVIQSRPDYSLDGQMYAAMRHGEDVPAPFRYRVAVPLLARLVPLPTPDALRLLTYAGLTMAYILAWLSARAVGASPLAAWVGVAAMIVSPVTVGYFQNPYLTDGLGLAALFGLVWARLTNHYAAFLGLLVLGGTIRETPLVLAPSWGLSRRSALALVVAASVWIGLRLALGWVPPPHGAPSARWAWHLLIGWHVFWVLAPLGLTHLRRPVAWWIAGCLVLGTAGSLLIADTLRMLAALSPVVVLGISGAVSRITRRIPR
jgi:hypothetical protein